MKRKHLFKNIPTHMDYEGQKLAERLFHVIILFFGVVGFLWGYYIQQFGASIVIVAAGFIVSCILVLPPWPLYRKHALDWQKPRPEKDNTKRRGKKKQKRWQENFREGDTAWGTSQLDCLHVLSQLTTLPTASAGQTNL